MKKIQKTLIITLSMIAFVFMSASKAASFEWNIFQGKKNIQTSVVSVDNKVDVKEKTSFFDKLSVKKSSDKAVKSKDNAVENLSKDLVSKSNQSKKVQKKQLFAKKEENNVEKTIKMKTVKDSSKPKKVVKVQLPKKAKSIEGDKNTQNKESKKLWGNKKTKESLELQQNDVTQTDKVDKKKNFVFIKRKTKNSNVESSKPEKVTVDKKAKIKKNKKSKYDDKAVIAKTDASQYTVKIYVDDKEAKKALEKQKKETTVKNKHFSKPKKAKALEQKLEEQTPIELATQQDAMSQEGDAFSANPASIEGAVSTTHIISVDDCVKIALQNNPVILSQLISKDIYKNKIAQAWANYFPTLNAGLSYSKNDMLMTNFKFPMQEYNLWNTPNVGVNMLLFDFGKTGAQAGVATKTYEAARETLQSSINEVVYSVKSAYYNLLYLQQQVEVYEDSVMQYEVHLEQAKAYYDIGSKAKIDVTTAAYNLDNSKLTLIQAKNSVDTGFAQLTNAMGVPEFAKFDIKDKLDKKRYDISFDEALKIACEQNPNLLAAKKKMEGSKLLVKSSKVAFLPDVKGFGSYTRGGKKTDTDYGYQIGAQLTYSNLNLLLLKKQVDEANLTYKKDQADYETQRQKIYLDVKQSFIQLKNAQESIPVSRSSMEVAKERYELAAGRYKVGLGDAIELKDAQNTYLNARLQYYNTLLQYHISAANLERVIGSPLVASETKL